MRYNMIMFSKITVKAGVHMAAEAKPVNAPVVKVTFLGGFSMDVDGKVITDEMNRSLKIWNLLAYLIIHRRRNIPQAELIETFWPEDEDGNPVSALKTLFFRMRRMIASVIGEDIQLITSQRGSYSWNRKIECIVDIDEFEELSKKAGDGRAPDDERIALYERATALYKGDFMPKLSGQLWIIPISARSHSIYLSTVCEYAKLLEKAARYEDMAALCRRAIEIDALDDDLHVLLLRALMAQDKHSEALSHYERATDMMYRNLGVHPSNELRGIYSQIMKVQKTVETDLGVIQAGLKEYASHKGAFLCDYGFFQEAFRLSARQALRDGTSMQIALITVALPDGSIPRLDLLSTVMERLQEIIMTSLRRGDVVSRYSGAQYIILLPSANYEDSVKVITRIKKTFIKKYRSSPVRLSCSIQQMELEGLYD